MTDREYESVLSLGAVDDKVGKSPRQNLACTSAHGNTQRRILLQKGKDTLYLHQEVYAQACSFSFIKTRRPAKILLSGVQQDNRSHG